MGLVWLIGLGIWVLLTPLAMTLGYKAVTGLGGNRAFGLLSMFAVFMLMIGGWIVYWIIEYQQAKAYAASVCGLAGYQIYVQPEEWKKTVSSEEWNGFKRYKVDHRLNGTSPLVITFEKNEYELSTKYNDRIVSYQRTSGEGYTSISEYLIYDSKRKEVLLKHTNVYTETSHGWNSLSELKFWINGIPNCKSSRSFGNLLETYYDRSAK